MKAIAELREEREHIEQTIRVLQQLGSTTKRRGRPPKWLAGVEPARRRRKGLSAAARKGRSERMKKYWAAKRKAKT